MLNQQAAELELDGGTPTSTEHRHHRARQLSLRGSPLLTRCQGHHRSGAPSPLPQLILSCTATTTTSSTSQCDRAFQSCIGQLLSGHYTQAWLCYPAVLKSQKNLWFDELQYVYWWNDLDPPMKKFFNSYAATWMCKAFSLARAKNTQPKWITDDIWASLSDLEQIKHLLSFMRTPMGFPDFFPDVQPTTLAKADHASTDRLVQQLSKDPDIQPPIDEHDPQL
ncbi:hypothetical protein Salat_0519500 [Sesamum alatum]|uniref:Uncharacterized protein n=1 Tax=Sesamum alatum TaxID=300844 RepID=A0AAE2D100_9LAMI|nr:hypothetical protein Salat_0519500 [Sesamum alatum]